MERIPCGGRRRPSGERGHRGGIRVDSARGACIRFWSCCENSGISLILLQEVHSRRTFMCGRFYLGQSSLSERSAMTVPHGGFSVAGRCGALKAGFDEICLEVAIAGDCLRAMKLCWGLSLRAWICWFEGEPVLSDFRSQLPMYLFECSGIG